MLGNLSKNKAYYLDNPPVFYNGLHKPRYRTGRIWMVIENSEKSCWLKSGADLAHYIGIPYASQDSSFQCRHVWHGVNVVSIGF